MNMFGWFKKKKKRPPADDNRTSSSNDDGFLAAIIVGQILSDSGATHSGACEAPDTSSYDSGSSFD